MAEVNQLTKTFAPKYLRDRRLNQTPVSPPPSEVPTDTTPEIQQIRNNYAAVAGKAERLLTEAAQLAIVRRVPVDSDATEVRGAVQRQDEASQGLFITFDLYRTAYEYLQRESRALPLSVLDVMTGDFSTDRLRVARMIREHTDDLTAEAAQLIGDQIVTLFILKLLLLGYDAASTGAQTGTKQPSTVELPIIAIQIATSLVAQQLYAGLNAQQAEDALGELTAQLENVPAPNVQAARDFLKSSPLFNTALVQRRSGDYRLIVNYVQAFLDRQTEPGWETWQCVSELQEAASWARETATLLTRYNAPEPTQGVEPPRDPLTHITNAIRGNVEVAGSTPPAPTDLTLDLYQLGLDRLNQQVDHLGYLLGAGLDIENLCCFLKYLNGLGTRPVRILRSTLDVAQNLINQRYSLNSPQFQSSLSISTLIHQQAMLLLQDLKETAYQRLQEWLLTDPEAWSELFRGCALIDELAEYLTFALEGLEAKLISLLDRYLGFLEDREQRLSARLNQIGNQQHVRTQMLVMDQWLEFGGAEGGICPETPSEPTQIAGAAERILGRLGSGIDLSVEGLGGNPYTTLQSPPLVLDNKIRIPSPPGASAGSDLLAAAQEACRSGVVTQNLVPFPRG